jgi:hypothetical protein
MSASNLFAPCFDLGDVVATPGVAALIAKGLMVDLYLTRHHADDWGDIEADDAQANTDGVETGDRLLSAYETPYGRIWIITEAERTSTCVLLPREY